MKKPRNSAIYCRISQDRNGEGLGTSRQRQDCQQWAADHGWGVTEVYTDDDISAFNGKHRPAYRRMLTDIAEGRRDGLIAWHNDRLTRHPRELEDLVEVVERTGVPIGTVSAGNIDLSTPTGRMLARIVGATARQESEHKAERIVRKHVEIAEDGRPSGGGRRPFGYEPDGVTVRPDEAKLVEEASERILDGEGLRTVVNDWNRRGVHTVTGAQWSATTLRRLLRSGRLSGQREHHGRITGKATWPAIVDPSTTTRLRAVLDDPERDNHHGEDNDYLLAGLVRCGACGATMTSRPVRRKGIRYRRYHCLADRGGCNGVGIIADRTEETVVEAVLQRLDSVTLRRAVTKRSKPKDGQEAHLRALEAKEAELGEMWASGQLSRTGWSAARDRLAKEIEQTRAHVTGQVTEEAAANLVGQGASLAKRWDGLGIERQRAIVAAVVEAVVIAPTSKAANRFDGSRITAIWRA